MGKFDAPRRMSQREIDKLFIDFAKALASVRNSVEAANLIKDLLTEQEVVIFARRLQIARLLEQGYTYGQIHRVMRVGNSTVAKVHAWMDLSGGGFKMVIKRTQSSESSEAVNYDSASRFSHKRKYPMYYWPELLLQEIVKSANKKEKERLLGVIEGLRKKTRISRELTKILRLSQFSHTPVHGRIKD